MRFILAIDTICSGRLVPAMETIVASLFLISDE
jgi:hypothetical protein